MSQLLTRLGCCTILDDVIRDVRRCLLFNFLIIMMRFIASSSILTFGLFCREDGRYLGEVRSGNRLITSLAKKSWHPGAFAPHGRRLGLHSVSQLSRLPDVRRLRGLSRAGALPVTGL
jgi:hypothetical protein